MFALVDCNNFYASCERVFKPDLNGKPVVVLSNNDGCVIARSDEAKSLGIPMGAPAFKYRKFFEERNITVFSSNYALYGDMSNRVMTILSSYTPDIEIYSIDEAFLKFEGFHFFNIEEYGSSIREKVTKSTGIPISLGFAETKSLAKAANRIAKKFPDKTNGVYVINTEKKRIKALKWLKVEDIWGIGRRNSLRLNKLGVFNAYEFTQLSDELVRKELSVVGLRLKRDLEGKPTLSLEEISAKKSIATTRTFESNYTSLEQLKERVSTFAVTCAEKLRKEASCCNAMLIFLHTNQHRSDLIQYKGNTFIRLPFPSNSSIELSKFATRGLERIFKKGFEYKKAGIVVMDITPENSVQLNLFENSNPKHKKILAAIDSINRSLGHQKVKLGSQDIDRTWKMRQERLSPRYTTRLRDIITVKV
ncbi:MAG: Y-family DNA polymerase [Chitinophagales bacterium]